jgi:hypothetical protein
MREKEASAVVENKHLGNSESGTIVKHTQVTIHVFTVTTGSASTEPSSDAFSESSETTSALTFSAVTSCCSGAWLLPFCSVSAAIAQEGNINRNKRLEQIQKRDEKRK